MLRDPSPELFQLLMKEGERATWPKISAIRTHARIGKTLDQCLARLDQKREQLLADDPLSVPDAHGSHDAGILQIEARRRHRSQVS
jgi:hypothetical protein